MSSLPVVCTLTPETRRTRQAALWPGLMRRTCTYEETPDGCRLGFAASPEILNSIALVIDAERQCCRFLRFGITVEPDGGPIWLALTGPPGTREFLRALMEE